MTESDSQTNPKALDATVDAVVDMYNLGVQFKSKGISGVMSDIKDEEALVSDIESAVQNAGDFSAEIKGMDATEVAALEAGIEKKLALEAGKGALVLDATVKFIEAGFNLKAAIES